MTKNLIMMSELIEKTIIQIMMVDWDLDRKYHKANQ